ncbi:MAG: hypothetical protein L3K14_01520 [Thermoplasmata archaeon]|nr:hypothetical protein [Thermoplasmata archaeon]
MGGRKIRVPAVLSDVKGIPVYSGKIKPSDLLAVYDVKQFSAEELDWYQRKLFEKKARDVQAYLERCPISVIPALLVGVGAESIFAHTDGQDFGTLSVPRVQKSIRVIDGQHRVAGFQLIADELSVLESRARLDPVVEEPARERREFMRHILDSPIPITAVDISGAIKAAEGKRAAHFKNQSLTQDEAERVIFFILNKTQKGLNPSLRDQLAYRIWFSGIRGIPAIEEEEWRPYATRLVEDLNRHESPLKGLIAEAAASPGMARRVRLSSFVTSLRDLFDIPEFFDKETEQRDEKFRESQHEKELKYLREYWTVLRYLFPDAFQDTARHLLLRTLAVYALNGLAADVFKWALPQGKTPTKERVKELVGPLAGFDWTRDKSPIKAFGGERGATEAHRLLLTRLADSGSSEAVQSLNDLDSRGT